MEAMEAADGYIPEEYWDGSSYLIYRYDEHGLAADWMPRYGVEEAPPAPPSWKDNFKAEDLDRKCTEASNA